MGWTRAIGMLAAGVIGLVACAPTSSADPTATLDGSPPPGPTDTAGTSTPPTVGTTFTSDRYGYAIAVPEGWTISETPGEGGLHPDEPGVDTFRSGRGHILSVVGEAIAAGTALDAWTCAINLHLMGEHETPSSRPTSSGWLAGRCA